MASNIKVYFVFILLNLLGYATQAQYDEPFVVKVPYQELISMSSSNNSLDFNTIDKVILFWNSTNSNSLTAALNLDSLAKLNNDKHIKFIAVTNEKPASLTFLKSYFSQEIILMSDSLSKFHEFFDVPLNSRYQSTYDLPQIYFLNKKDSILHKGIYGSFSNRKIKQIFNNQSISEPNRDTNVESEINDKLYSLLKIDMADSFILCAANEDDERYFTPSILNRSYLNTSKTLKGILRPLINDESEYLIELEDSMLNGRYFSLLYNDKINDSKDSANSFNKAEFLNTIKAKVLASLALREVIEDTGRIVYDLELLDKNKLHQNVNKGQWGTMVSSNYDYLKNSEIKSLVNLLSFRLNTIIYNKTAIESGEYFDFFVNNQSITEIKKDLLKFGLLLTPRKKNVKVYYFKTKS